MKKTVTLLGLLVFCLGFSSCKSLGIGVRAPSVSLHSVEITGVSLKGVEMLCTLNVENPNPVSLSFPEIDWELFINSNSFISGIVENKEMLEARKITVVTIPLSLDYAGLLTTLKSFKGRKDVDYQINLGTRFLLPILGERVWNFEHDGKIPLVQMIAFRNPAFKIEKLDFTGVDILLSVDVENPNPFPVPFPETEYNYAVRNSNFITGTVEQSGSLAAGLTPVNIRLRVVYSDLYRNFSALGSAGEAFSLFSLSSQLSLPGYDREKISLDISGTLPLLKPPVLSFRGITVKNISLSRIDLEFGLDVENPNGFNLGIRDLDYSLTVNNTPWTQGKVSESPELSAGRKTTIPVTVSINTPALVKDLTTLITQGMDVTYDLRGNLALSSNLEGFFDIGAPYSLTGRTKLRR
jgi:LEA14-like dessication related protein